MTQAEFAALIGVTQGEVSKLCNDKVGRRPSWDMAARIQEATDGAVPVTAWLPSRASA